MIDYLFHVHTYRCGHADMVSEECYVQKAISLGYKKIYFSDHNPFPDNRFTNRMKYEELTDYISVLSSLKNKYKEDISIYIGLETDYLPQYDSLYAELSELTDFLLLGQHLYLLNGKYNFELSKNIKDANECYEEYKLIIKGLSTGYFQYLAHPDRIFRKQGKWNDDMAKISQDIIDVAVKNNIKLEKNLCSMTESGSYREAFWEHVPQSMIVIGQDIHKISDLEKYHDIIYTESKYGKYAP